MLKSSIQLRENVDIAQYKKVVALLKCKNDYYVPKKSKILNMENVLKFLTDALDDTYLLIKVALLFGLNGACRRCELCYLTINDIEDTGKFVIVTLRDTKTKKFRVFTVTDECNAYDYYKRYVAIRPQKVANDRFFLNYRNGKCTVQPIGINTFGTFPQKIARFLNLPDDHMYTGHCFRRTFSSFLADSGADMDTLKRHGVWKSATVAEGYIKNSISNKISFKRYISMCIVLL